MTEIIAVFQDCVLCGEKGRRKIAEYAKKGITIRKVGFTTEEGKDLIHKAVFEHKIGSMPFYTDGERFGATMDELLGQVAVEKPIPKEPKIVKKIRRKAVLERKKKITEKESGNGTNTEI